ncbi:MAG TPA: MBL fold metallo-hydrolase [Acetobacteraceae bacterium]|nr:MBL fold metallo-hydrolase [Acetobacteraceae bacterium]
MSGLSFPFAAPPAPGEIRPIADGVLWLRLPLPYRLDHVNIYLIEEPGGFAALDCGLGNDRSKALWQAALERLSPRRLTRLIVTHYHPDHVGLAGWLCAEYGLQLHMPRPEYLFSLALQYAPGDLGADMHRPFYLRHGLDADTTDIVLSRGHEYLRRTTGVPTTYHRLQHGDVMRFGARETDVLTGGGHALEQAMLVDRANKLFFAADQVIARISPNVSVHAMEPDADALGIYLRSLAAIRVAVPDELLVLPGHGLPFHGLHARIDALTEHHASRCALIAAACRDAPLSAAELIPHVFNRELDPHQTSFAFGEVLAHVNYMLRGGELNLERGADGIDRYRAA